MSLITKIEQKNLTSLYNLPLEVKYCVTCTISNQRPRISLDENGVCSACNFAEFKKNKINWSEREKELMDLCNRFRKKDGSFDVIVPCSGGKDSAYIAHELKHKYNMNPLTATWAPHIYTEIGFQNLQNMIRIGDLYNICGSAPGETHRKMTKLSFEILGDPFQPFIYGQTNYPMQIAKNFGIPLIMYGENGEVEYGGDMKNAFNPQRNYKSDHVKHYFSGIAPEDLTKYGIDKKNIVPYLSPEIEDLEKIGTEIHFYGYYKKWIPQENYYYCVENTGFKANPERIEGTYQKYAGLDDQIDGFHYYLAYIKFCLGRATSDTAHEIRDGHLTRNEGIALISKFDGEFPKKYFDVFLKYIDLTEEEFHVVIDSWRSPHLWEKINGEWKQKHRIDGKGTKD